MARNKLTDLNDHLFAQLERLDDEKLSGEQIQKEVTRAGAISKIASQVIQNAKVNIEALKLLGKGVFKAEDLPDNFGINPKTKVLDS